jgi:phosphatidylserine decarboxylase
MHKTIPSTVTAIKKPWLSTVIRYCQILLTRVIGYLARYECRMLTQLFIQCFCYKYPVNLDEFEPYSKEQEKFPSWDAFFTRRLKKGIRPFPAQAADYILSPVDGRIIAQGQISSSASIHVKTANLSLEDMVLGDANLLTSFRNGSYIILYLAPHNYHRIHAAVPAKIESYAYQPGMLYPVKPSSILQKPQIYCENERMNLLFNTAHGQMLHIMVGALIVSGIETPWHHSQQSPYQTGWQQLKKFQTIKQGEEIGCFHMGSAVVLLFSRPTNWQRTVGEAINLHTILGKPEA